MDVIRMLLVECCNGWCVVLNHYDLGLYVESWLKSFVISRLPGLWELKYRNLIASVIVFVLTFLWFGRFCYRHHKLLSPWEGPFIVSKVTWLGSFELMTEDGIPVRNSWHISQLQRFYAWRFKIDFFNPHTQEYHIIEVHDQYNKDNIHRQHLSYRTTQSRVIQPGWE